MEGDAISARLVTQMSEVLLTLYHPKWTLSLPSSQSLPHHHHNPHNHVL
jgi:hypothetical protein